MANNSVVGMPGIGNSKTATPREILLSQAGAVYSPKRITIDGSKSRDAGNTGNLDVLRAGMIMAKRFDDAKYAPLILGLTTAVGTTTTLTVSAATAVEVNRRFGSSGTQEMVIVSDINDATYEETVVTSEAITHSAVDTSTGVITVDAMGSTHASGSLLLAVDGTRVDELPRLQNLFILGESYDTGDRRRAAGGGEASACLLG